MKIFQIFQLEHEDVSRNCFIDYVIYDFPGQVSSASIFYLLYFIICRFICY